jgi:hypothetical protein
VERLHSVVVLKIDPVDDEGGAVLELEQSLSYQLHEA